MEALVPFLNIFKTLKHLHISLKYNYNFFLTKFQKSFSALVDFNECSWGIQGHTLWYNVTEYILSRFQEYIHFMYFYTSIPLHLTSKYWTVSDNFIFFHRGFSSPPCPLVLMWWFSFLGYSEEWISPSRADKTLIPLKWNKFFTNLEFTGNLFSQI